jgi:hypothetical protein
MPSADGRTGVSQGAARDESPAARSAQRLIHAGEQTIAQRFWGRCALSTETRQISGARDSRRQRPGGGQDRSARKLTWGDVDSGCDWLRRLM